MVVLLFLLFGFGEGVHRLPRKQRPRRFFAGGLFVCGYFRLVDAFDLINIRTDLRRFLAADQADDQVSLADRVIRDILNQGEALDLAAAANVVARRVAVVDDVADVDVFLVVEGDRHILTPSIRSALTGSSLPSLFKNG